MLFYMLTYDVLLSKLQLLRFLYPNNYEFVKKKASGAPWSSKGPVDSCFRGPTCSRGPSYIQWPHCHRRVPLTLVLGAPLVLGLPLALHLGPHLVQGPHGLQTG